MYEVLVYQHCYRENILKSRKKRRRKNILRKTIILVVFVVLTGFLMAGLNKITTNQGYKVIAENSVLQLDTKSSKKTDVIVIPLEPEESDTDKMLKNGILSDDIALDYDLQLCTRDAAEIFNVPYKLHLAVMFRESNFNPTPSTNEICYGLMQIHKMNFEWLESELSEFGVTDVKNKPEDNIYAGAFILGNLIEKYGDYNLVLMAYNCGENGAKRLWEQGYTSSSYSRKVLETMNEFDVLE